MEPVESQVSFENEIWLISRPATLKVVTLFTLLGVIFGVVVYFNNTSSDNGILFIGCKLFLIILAALQGLVVLANLSFAEPPERKLWKWAIGFAFSQWLVASLLLKIAHLYQNDATSKIQFPRTWEDAATMVFIPCTILGAIGLYGAGLIWLDVQQKQVISSLAFSICALFFTYVLSYILLRDYFTNERWDLFEYIYLCGVLSLFQSISLVQMRLQTSSLTSSINKTSQ